MHIPTNVELIMNDNYNDRVTVWSFLLSLVALVNTFDKIVCGGRGAGLGA